MKASIKAALRRILGPLVRPILWRMRRFTGLRAEVDELRAVLPAVVNAASSVAAIGHEQARMKRDHDRAIAELRAAVARLSGTAASSMPARILSADKVERARANGLRLHLGGANTAGEGFVCVDTTEGTGVDVVAGFDALPFAPGEVAEIVCAQPLDRFEAAQGERMLAHWARLLRPGGTLRITK